MLRVTCTFTLNQLQRRIDILIRFHSFIGMKYHNFGFWTTQSTCIEYEFLKVTPQDHLDCLCDCISHHHMVSQICLHEPRTWYVMRIRIFQKQINHQSILFLWDITSSIKYLTVDMLSRFESSLVKKAHRSPE